MRGCLMSLPILLEGACRRPCSCERAWVYQQVERHVNTKELQVRLGSAVVLGHPSIAIMSRTLKEVVQLRSARVTEFRSILNKIEKDTPYNVAHYQPLHEAVKKYHNSPNGDLTIIHSACARLDLAIARAMCKRDQIRPRTNLEALQGYVDHHATPFRRSLGGLPGSFQSYHWEVNGLVITGKPHLLVEGKDGRPKYLYLSTSKGWEIEDIRFAANLLGTIVTQNVSNVLPKDIEVLDCRSGERILAKPLGIRDQNALTELAALLCERGLN